MALRKRAALALHRTYQLLDGATLLASPVGFGQAGRPTRMSSGEHAWARRVLVVPAAAAGDDSPPPPAPIYAGSLGQRSPARAMWLATLCVGGKRVSWGPPRDLAPSHFLPKGDAPPHRLIWWSRGKPRMTLAGPGVVGGIGQIAVDASAFLAARRADLLRILKWACTDGVWAAGGRARPSPGAQLLGRPASA